MIPPDFGGRNPDSGSNQRIKVKIQDNIYLPLSQMPNGPVQERIFASFPDNIRRGFDSDFR
jgi:hypothetical protein